MRDAIMLTDADFARLLDLRRQHIGGDAAAALATDMLDFRRRCR